MKKCMGGGVFVATCREDILCWKYMTSTCRVDAFERGQKALAVKPYSCWLSHHCKYLIKQLINPNIVSQNRKQLHRWNWVWLSKF